MEKGHLVQNQQRVREILKEPPLISYRKGKSLKDLLVRASSEGHKTFNTTKCRSRVMPVAYFNQNFYLS